jgi:DNA-directed RNA polymerase subunit H (RpoH/RPB5)
MSLQIYPPIIITSVIINEFFPYRNFTLKSQWLSDDEIISDMEKFGFIRIDGINNTSRGNRNHIIVIILKSNDQSNPELKKIKKIIENIDSNDSLLDELFLIANKELFDKKNFNDIIKELHNRQKNGTDVNGTHAFYTICPYHNFAFSIPKCKSIFPHEIMTKEEVTELLQKERISIKDLPIILTNDPPIIWNGGRVGQVVRIIRNSESAMHALYYRRIETHIK